MRVIISLIFLIPISVQQELECSTDIAVMRGAIYVNPYYRDSRLKCTFYGVESVDQMKAAMGNYKGTTLQYASVQSMVFNQSTISTIPDRMFSSFTNLRNLDMSNMRVNSLSTSAMSGLKAIDFISLSKNQIRTLQAKVFDSMKFRSLDLSYNLIETIDENAFTDCEIEEVNLSFNKIKSVKYINGFKFFKLMHINDNQIEAFDKIDIKKWSVQHNGFFITTQYPTLNMQNNQLRTFECVSTLKWTVINLGGNVKLKEINLNKCEIARIDVSECTNLKNIKITDKVSGFTAKNVIFEQIDLSDSKSLETLSLVNNSLTADQISAIMTLGNLTSLELSYNNVGPLNISTFSKLKDLTSLSLKATNISNINFGTFSHQSNIRELDISDNNLQVFDMHMIFTMNSLAYLDLSGNGLTDLANIESAHLTFTVLEKIDLTNNRWTCKYLMKLIRIMKAYRVTLVQSSVEEHKSNINGIYCENVDGDDSIIAPLSPDSVNVTDIREKMNEIVGEMSKGAKFQSNIEKRISSLEMKIDARQETSNAALRSEHINSIESIEVKNSSLLEFALFVVCLCCTIYILMQIFLFVKRNFLNRPKPIRGISEHTLTINDENY